MKMIGRATNPEVLTASTQASFRNTGALKSLPAETFAVPPCRGSAY